MAKIDAFFNLMIEVGASDLHLASGSQPIVRVRGEMERINHPPWRTTHSRRCSTKSRPNTR